jgi:hypothetical protein
MAIIPLTGVLSSNLRYKKSGASRKYVSGKGDRITALLFPRQADFSAGG